MFVVEYSQKGIWGDTMFFQEIKPYLCHHLFNSDHTTWVNKDTNIISFINTANIPHSYVYLCKNIRIPQMDGPEPIRNRFAYTNLVLTYRIEENPVIFSRSLQILKKHNLPSDFLWLYAPEKTKEFFRNIVKKILIRLAEKVYAPDYVWKTKGCKTTMQLMEQSWEDKLLMAIPTM